MTCNGPNGTDGSNSVPLITLSSAARIRVAEEVGALIALQDWPICVFRYRWQLHAAVQLITPNGDKRLLVDVERLSTWPLT
jgi:hypothetical protein